MIDMAALQTRIVTGLRAHLQPLGVTAVIERDQTAPAPSHPFVGFKWIALTPEAGNLRRTREMVTSKDPRFPLDVQYTYVRNPVMTLSVTLFDTDVFRVHLLTQAAHDWFSVPELGSDWLQPTGAAIVEVTSITDRTVILDEQIERREGFDVRLRVLDIVQVTVPTIERVRITGMDGTTREIEL